MTQTMSQTAVSRTALMLAALAGIMALVLLVAQAAGLTGMTLSSGAETTVAFQVQADGFTWLPAF